MLLVNWVNSYLMRGIATYEVRSLVYHSSQGPFFRRTNAQDSKIAHYSKTQGKNTGEETINVSVEAGTTSDFFGKIKAIDANSTMIGKHRQ
jgi:hypothetical protein